jgi:uncharacterized protein YbjT (DUF2867 family)
MPRKPTILAYCANGLQGHAIVSQLRHAGFPVRAMVRDIARSARLRRLGAEVVQADLDAPDSLRDAHRNIDVALVQLPAGEGPADLRRHGRAAIDAMLQAGVPRIIFNAAVGYPRAVAELPSFEARQSLEQHVHASGLRWATIRQPFLLQNLLLPWVVRGIATDAAIIYPVRADLKLSWVAAEDVGRLAAAIVDGDIFGETIQLAAEQPINGEALAGRFADALGRPIRFVSLPLADFERGVDATVGPGAGKRIGAIFRFIEEHPEDRAFVATAHAASPRLPGFAPLAIPDWVRMHSDAYVGEST